MANILSPELAVNPSVPIQSVETASELNLAPTEIVAPIYKYRRLIQNGNGAGNVLNLQQTSTTQSMFVIPGHMVFNPSKSFVTMDVAVATPTNYNHLFGDSLPIDSIILQTDSGTEIAKILNAQPYTKVMQPFTLDMDEYESRGPVYGDIAANSLFPVISNYGCQSMKQLASANAEAVPYYPFNNYLTGASTSTTGVYSLGGQSNAIGGLNAITVPMGTGSYTIAALPDSVDAAGRILPGSIITVTANGADPSNPPVGVYRLTSAVIIGGTNQRGVIVLSTGATAAAGIILNLVGVSSTAVSGAYQSTAAGVAAALSADSTASSTYISAVSGVADVMSEQHMVTSGSTNTLFVRCRFSLSAFVGTVLAMNKDLYFGQNMQLYINWQQTNRWGFDGTIAGATATGLGANSATPLTITNYYLWVAEDIVEENTKPIVAQAKSVGINMLVPWTNSNSLSVTSSNNGTFSYPVQLNPGTGVSLKRCVVVPILSSNSLASSNNNDNVNSVKYQYVQSFLDAKPLQDLMLNNATSDVFNWLKPQLEGTAVGLSNRVYQINNFWIDNFSDARSGSQIPYNDVKESGMYIDIPRQYNVQFQQSAAAGGNLLLCGYQTWVRRLAIKPDGVYWSG